MKMVIFLKDETKKPNVLDGAEKRSSEEKSEDSKKEDDKPQPSHEVTALDDGTAAASAAGPSAADTGKKDKQNAPPADLSSTLRHSLRDKKKKKEDEANN